LRRQLWGLPVSNPWNVYAVTGDGPNAHKIGFIVSRGRDDELDLSVLFGGAVKFYRSRRHAWGECHRLRAIDEMQALEKELEKTIEQGDERGHPLVHEEEYLRDRIAEAKKSLELRRRKSR